MIICDSVVMTNRAKISLCKSMFCSFTWDSSPISLLYLDYQIKKKKMNKKPPFIGYDELDEKRKDFKVKKKREIGKIKIMK